MYGICHRMNQRQAQQLHLLLIVVTPLVRFSVELQWIYAAWAHGIVTEHNACAVHEP